MRKLTFVLLSLLLATSVTCFATVFTVSNLNDAGAGSLRQAISNANADGSATSGSPHIINFNLPGQVDLVSKLPNITNHMTINGDASGNTINRASATAFGIINITQDVTIELNNLIITNGFSGGRGGGINFRSALVPGGSISLNNCVVANNSTNSAGGGIATQRGASMTMINCSVINNTASGDGGGIHLRGTDAVMINVTISGNTASLGGGISNPFGGNGTSHFMFNCTVVNNTATNPSFPSGGYDVQAFDLNLVNNIFADNTPQDLLIRGNTNTNINTNTNNLVESCSSVNPTQPCTWALTGDPALTGATLCGIQTIFALSPSSIAVNAGSTGGSVPSTDICGTSRDANPDLGSFEIGTGTVAPGGPGGNVASIPTLSEWGLLFLFLGLLSVASVVIAAHTKEKVIL